MPSYYINGEEPQLVGAQCTGFALHHFSEGHQITDQVNVAHLRLGDQWYRLHSSVPLFFGMHLAILKPRRTMILRAVCY